MSPGEPVDGVLFDIQRWSTEDGPGIRTTLFFKGCPLRCAWCSNPESWSPKPQLGLFAERCLGCGLCTRVCPHAGPIGGAPEPCETRGRCADACPHGARQLLGRRMELEEILQEVERDRPFHRRSGGGVTFSGGEATCQPRLLGALAQRLQATGTHLALETCGHFSWSENEAALRRMDLVYFDLKHMDPLEHERLTGLGNGLILENAVAVARLGVPMIVRVPLVPGHNDGSWNLEATARFVLERLGRTVPIELLPYHALGDGKLRAIGGSCSLEGLRPPGPGALAEARAILAAAGAVVA